MIHQSSPISGTTTLYIIEDEPVLYQTLPAYPPLDPPDFGAASPEVRNQDLNLNAYGQVGDESTQVGTNVPESPLPVPHPFTPPVASITPGILR